MKKTRQYNTRLTDIQIQALRILAKGRGEHETVVARAAIDAYIQQCAGELRAILGVRAKALSAGRE